MILPVVEKGIWPFGYPGTGCMLSLSTEPTVLVSGQRDGPMSITLLKNLVPVATLVMSLLFLRGVQGLPLGPIWVHNRGA